MSGNPLSSPTGAQSCLSPARGSLHSQDSLMSQCTLTATVFNNTLNNETPQFAKSGEAKDPPREALESELGLSALSPSHRKLLERMLTFVSLETAAQSEINTILNQFVSEKDPIIQKDTKKNVLWFCNAFLSIGEDRSTQVKLGKFFLKAMSEHCLQEHEL